MTEQEIKEYNKRCAEFLGLTLHKGFGSKPKTYFRKNKETDTATIFHDVDLNSDWNWIMEVVEAIENIQIKGQYIYSIQPRGATCEIKCSTQYSLAFDVEMPCIYEIAKTKKEAVIQAINQFLIWYNNEKK